MIWSIEPIRLATALVPGPEVFFQRDFGRRLFEQASAPLKASDRA